MARRHKGIIFVVFIAFVIRLFVVLLAIQFREHPDVLRWKDWGRIAFLYGFSDTYTSAHLAFGTYPNNMPPGTLYVVSAMYWVWLQIGKLLSYIGIAPGSNAWVNVVLLQIILRIPSLVADIGIGSIVYIFSYTFGRRQRDSIIAASLFLFNPVVIYNSAFWGQMDAINNFFGLLSLWLLVRQKYVASVFSLLCSLCVKFSLIFISPFIALMLIVKQKNSIRLVVSAIGVCIFVLAVSAFPISREPFVWWWQYITHNATGEMTNITAFAFNVWWVIFHPHLMFGSSYDLTKVVDVWLVGAPLTQTTIGQLSLGNIAIGISALVQLPVYWWFFTCAKEKSMQAVLVISVFTMLSLLSFLLLPQMHERYMYPAFAPLAILVGLGLPLRREFILLSLCNFVNLLIVWHPMPLPIWVFDIMRNVSFQWWVALLTTLVGFWTVGKIFRTSKTI